MNRTLSTVILATFMCLSIQAAAQPAPTPAPSAVPASPAEPPPTKVDVSIVKMPDSPPGPVLSLEALKGGKLLASGFSLGGAYSLHIPANFLLTGKEGQEPSSVQRAQDLNSSFMPYVAFYPLMFLFSSGEETRAYCSTSWALAPQKTAQNAADKHAFQRAKDQLEAKAEAKEEDAAGTDATAETKKEAAELRQKADKFKNLEFDKYKKLPHAEAKVVTGYISDETGWTIGDAGSCWWRLFGAYAGKPLGINPTIRPTDGLNDGTPAASSVVSFGAAWSPNAGVSVLAGFTYWTFPTEVAPSENRGFWTWTLGIGGNTDIVSALVK